MKKMCVIALTATMLANCTAVSAAQNAIANGDFENGTDGFGICYSSRNDTVMPSVFESMSISQDGAALRFVPGETLGEKESTSPASAGFAYQGIYSKTLLNVNADAEYTVSADVFAEGDGVKMRFVIVKDNRAVAVSPEFETEGGKWCSSTFRLTPESDMSDARVRIAFYGIKSSESIYVDNFAFNEEIISNKSWKGINNDVQNDNEKIVFSAEKNNENGIVCTVSGGKFESGKCYALSFEVQTDAEKAYVSAYCDNAHKDFIIYANENVKVLLPFDADGDKTFKITGFGENGTEVTVKNAKIVDEYMIINAKAENGKISVSGKLRKGNENKVINIKVGELLQRTVITDENGGYALTASLPDVQKPRINAKIVVSGINGYSDVNGELTADCTVSDASYADGIAAEVSGKTKENISAVLTEEVLDNLGVSALPIFRTADKNNVFDSLAQRNFSDGSELTDAIICASAYSSLNSKRQSLCDVTDEYGALLNSDKSTAYKDIYSKIVGKSEVDKLFLQCEHKIDSEESYLFALAETLVRYEMKSLSNYSRQMALLQKYADELGLNFEKYLALSSEKQYSIASKWLENINNVTDYSTLQNSLDSLVANASSSDGSTGGTGSGGGSKTAGGGMSLSVDTAVTGTSEYRFDDLDSFAWAREAVYKLVEKGVISKPADKKFNPGANVTRAEMAKMTAVLANIAQYSGNDERFADVKTQDWYYKYVMALFDGGIVNGISSDVFGSDSPITRQDICVILSRILQNGEAVGTPSFTDFDSVSDYAKDAVIIMKQRGIVNGFEDGSFRPYEYATRAEVAKMLCNMFSE